MSFVHNPSEAQSTPSGRTASAVLGNLVARGALSTLSPSRLLDVLELGVYASGDQAQAQAVVDVEAALGGVDLASSNEAFVRASRFVLRELKAKPGEVVLLVNGRVRSPFCPLFLFNADSWCWSRSWARSSAAACSHPTSCSSSHTSAGSASGLWSKRSRTSWGRLRGTIGASFYSFLFWWGWWLLTSGR